MNQKANKPNSKSQTMAAIQKLSGIENCELAAELICLGAKAAYDSSKAVDLTLQTLQEEKPKDSTEVRLILQAHALFAQGMENLARAEKAELPYRAELRIKFAMKVLRLHNETIEMLNRYRRRGEQTMVVQHQYVQVNDGGKAIVGHPVMGGVRVEIKSEEPHGESYLWCQITEQPRFAMQTFSNGEWKMPLSWRENSYKAWALLKKSHH